MEPKKKLNVLVTGATGYVGGRLIQRLQECDVNVRCMARRPAQLAGRVSSRVEVVQGDVSDALTLSTALEGIDVAFYLVHSLAAGPDFEAIEKRGARNFARVARDMGVKRIVYLGGLGDLKPGADPAHMRSRHHVGEILRASSIPTLEFRASIIIGPGSLSFELIRSLVRKLPVMIVPKWVRIETQPIAIRDVLEYLVEAIHVPMNESSVYEIGGRERLSYLDLMKRYAAFVGLRRYFVNVPFLTPWLSSLWLNLVTPLFATVGRKLIDSIRVASVVEDDRALTDFNVTPMNINDAFRAATNEEDDHFRETHWSDALSSTGLPPKYGGRVYGSRIVDTRVVDIPASASIAFQTIEQIGGDTGWYYANWLWKVRGFLDRCMGGVGMQRGRRDPERLRTGDILDCWRVEALERPFRILLKAEMKVFGRAWLQFDVVPEDDSTTIRQTALYDPHGLLGIAYWYALYPLHEFVFRGMLNGIARTAMERDFLPMKSRSRKASSNLQALQMRSDASVNMEIEPLSNGMKGQ